MELSPRKTGFAIVACTTVVFVLGLTAGLADDFTVMTVAAVALVALTVIQFSLALRRASNAEAA